MNKDDGHFESRQTDKFRRYFEEMMVGKMRVDKKWLDESFGRYYPEEPPYLDPVARIPAVESQGIVGEVINTTGLASGTKNTFGAEDRAQYRAGVKAHLRWLADFSKAAPGRFACPVYIDGADLGEAIEDVTWARNQGVFGGVFLPLQRTRAGGMMSSTRDFSGPVLPAYMDPYWEPLWSLCEDLDLPLVLHVGQNVAPDIATAYGSDPTSFWVMSAFEHSFFAIRPFFQMIAGGVLDRHPRLRYCAAEIHVAALPGLFQAAEHHVKGFDGYQRRGLALPLSDYWYRHGYAAASLMRPKEVANRHEIGIRNLMWGSDFPHPEGAWPNSQLVLRHLFAGVPESELRCILGENPARCFGFDLEKLQKVADRVGPTCADLQKPVAAADKPPFASTFSLHTLAAE
jgi:predicted TIM-barrel fold metal-dependent hydrolase